jgi:hypothetical protein
MFSRPGEEKLMNHATWAFSLWWSNDEPLYRNVLAYATECLRRVPNMTDQTLGLNVRIEVQRWCMDGQATVLGWGPAKGYAWIVAPSVLDQMAREVGDFSAVDEVAVGESVRESLGVES